MRDELELNRVMVVTHTHARAQNELGLVESHRRLIAEAEVVLHKYKIEGGGGGGGTKGHASVDQPIAEPVRTIGNPHKAHVRKVFIFNDIIIVAKEAVSGKRGTKAEKKRNERKERERERERERAERAGGVALVDDEEEGKWRFMYQLDVETCQVDALEDSFDFISSRYTQKNAIRLSDSASGRVVRFVDLSFFWLSLSFFVVVERCLTTSGNTTIGLRWLRRRRSRSCWTSSRT